ncbi:hypothetical protein CRH09_26465 [Nocardia terpenica]|uniref:Uncharacterized protein n=1 Tax=Nocardia terpenica TaxID=455432 RepID=A0A291RPE3_9NOCA|nr:hypothetical protein CRH09_26465 [Nocardia terpenica]
MTVRDKHMRIAARSLIVVTPLAAGIAIAGVASAVPPDQSAPCRPTIVLDAVQQDTSTGITLTPTLAGPQQDGKTMLGTAYVDEFRVIKDTIQSVVSQLPTLIPDIMSGSAG